MASSSTSGKTDNGSDPGFSRFRLEPGIRDSGNIQKKAFLICGVATADRQSTDTLSKIFRPDKRNLYQRRSRHFCRLAAHPSAGPHGPHGQLGFRTKNEFTVAAASRRKPGASRAVKRSGQLQGDGQTTTRSSRVTQPARTDQRPPRRFARRCPSATTVTKSSRRRICHMPRTWCFFVSVVDPAVDPRRSGGCSRASKRGCPRGSA